MIDGEEIRKLTNSTLEELRTLPLGQLVRSALQLEIILLKDDPKENNPTSSSFFSAVRSYLDKFYAVLNEKEKEYRK